MSALILTTAVLGWGILHSFLASSEVKGYLAQRLGREVMRFYRLAYNLFSVITFLPIPWLMAILPDRQLYAIPWPWLGLTLTVQTAAVVLLVVGVLQTGWLDFVGLNALTNEPEPPPKMVVSGLYRWVRHPLYTAGLAFVWLTPVMTVNLLVVLIASTIYILLGARYEERKLLRQFGDEYARYQATTPMFIPGWKLQNQKD